MIGGAGIDTFNGGDGIDHLYGFASNDSLTGGAGNDYIVGGLGDDTISGGDGDDTIEAESGNDDITTGAGNDNVNGSLGNDVITVDKAGDKTVNGGAGSDTVVMSYSSVSPLSEQSISYNSSTSALTFTDSNGGTITAQAIENFTVGGTSYSFVDENGYHAQSGQTSIYMSHAFISSDGNEVIFYAPSSGSTKIGLDPNGAMSDFSGSDTWLDANLTITGSSASDAISDQTGGLNNLGSLTVNAGAGNDTVKITTLTSDADTINLGAGDDIVYVGSDYATDTLNGGTGTDWIAFHHNSYGSNSSAITYTINSGNSSNFENIGGTTYNDALTGDSNANKMFGGKGADTLTGLAGNDILIGDVGEQSSSNTSLSNDLSLTGALPNDHTNGGGDDTLYGGSGNDYLYGQVGEDTLDGGTGTDVYSGGAGADTFVIRVGDGSTTLADANVIRDFEDGTDVIGLAGGLQFSSLTIEPGSGDYADFTIVDMALSICLL